ncbi:EamA family transporter [Planktothrix mougeotii LEGE 06226]|uniref:EamA family transporter n=2 Tax=Microcoleaceae TaxID=1892252 RepID=A0ABR9U7H2_9CYAN|nr:EamA family transporter [Planktothrix sp. FACHB-1365]MBE9142413.1 EamA family transporter [Planktothrix mougeotii LEGE 06226]
MNTGIGNLLLKKSRLEAPDPSILTLLLSPWFMAAILVYGINLIVFAKALDRLPVSIAYPVFAAIGFSLVALMGSLFLGERVGLNQMIGLSFIVAGIVIMSR